MRRDLEWIGEKIPISDARWMGTLLKQLSHGQLVDAFRAGHFPPALDLWSPARVKRSRITRENSTQWHTADKLKWQGPD